MQRALYLVVPTGVAIVLGMACSSPQIGSPIFPSPTGSVTPINAEFYNQAVWTDASKSELWYTAQTNFKNRPGQITAVAVQSNGVSRYVYSPSAPVPVSFAGEHHTFLIVTTSAGSVPTGPLKFILQYTDGAVTSTSYVLTPMVANNTVTPPLGITGPIGDAGVVNVNQAAHDATHPGQVFFQFTPTLAVSFADVRIYDPSGKRVADCPQAASYVCAANLSQKPDLCTFTQTTGMISNLNYIAILRGGAAPGSTAQTEFFEITNSFAYSTNAQFAPTDPR